VPYCSNNNKQQIANGLTFSNFWIYFVVIGSIIIVIVIVVIIIFKVPEIKIKVLPYNRKVILNNINQRNSARNTTSMNNQSQPTNNQSQPSNVKV